jgi:[acyl-carrier-protein] S-malonyltransferase
MSKLNAATTLAMFPGQGSQYVGMGRQLLSEFPACKTAFEEAEDAARINIRKLCLEGPEDELKLTANTQPCILTVSAATWLVLEKEAGFQAQWFAGHSLGEYSALVGAGKLGLGRAAFLVRRRGEAMQAAVPAGTGAMAAIMGVAPELLQTRTAEVSRPGCVVEVVNFNSPQQLVVAGHKAAVEDLVKVLEADKARCVMLPVSAPFHSSLMTKAREVMEPLLRDTPLCDSPAKVIANRTGKVESPYQIQHLIEQIDHSVLWTQTLETAVAAGCTDYVEIGPGKVLAGLAKRQIPKEARLVHTDDIKAAITSLI